MSAFAAGYHGLTFARLREILARIGGVRIAVVGDAVLDIYWEADMTLSELSRETPHHNLPVVGERFSPGGGANVAANLGTLGAGSVAMASVIGDDWRGGLLLNELRVRGIGLDQIVVDGGRITPAYCKPRRRGFSEAVYEDPRLDFENRSPMPRDCVAKLLSSLDAVSGQADVIAVADQLYQGVVCEEARLRLTDIGAHKPVIVDSRDRARLFKGVIVKPNEMETLRAAELPVEKHPADEDIAEAALRLSKNTGAPVIVTLGARGALWADGERAVRIPSPVVPPPVDIVGAGDAFLAGFCCAFGTGCSGPEAAAFANLAAAVTVKKLDTTGTASPEEILEVYERTLGANAG